MRRSRVVLGTLAALALAAGAAVWASAAARTDRVWAFVPIPPWSEDPPPCVALVRGGAPLPPDRWTFAPLTQSGAAPVVVVTLDASAAWRRICGVLGIRTRAEQFVSADAGTAAPGGRWYECVRRTPDGR